MPMEKLSARPANLAAKSQLRNSALISGAGEGISTPDPLITNQMLYQLSYASMQQASPVTLIPFLSTGQV